MAWVVVRISTWIFLSRSDPGSDVINAVVKNGDKWLASYRIVTSISLLFQAEYTTMSFSNCGLIVLELVWHVWAVVCKLERSKQSIDPRGWGVARVQLCTYHVSVYTVVRVRSPNTDLKTKCKHNILETPQSWYMCLYPYKILMWGPLGITFLSVWRHW